MGWRHLPHAPRCSRLCSPSSSSFSFSLSGKSPSILGAILEPTRVIAQVSVRNYCTSSKQSGSNTHFKNVVHRERCCDTFKNTETESSPQILILIKIKIKIIFGRSGVRLTIRSKI
ncbi:hypothetical protein E2C01_000391 [Portunus trituberculatus]|uniref:Uncharacterized protein n=1 Tax=Portunus trituberculatus TaxID=210409 RepID=A0A5B7CJM3_PORTR|nr:hypothetical protein [Portunus trituberculatus]